MAKTKKKGTALVNWDKDFAEMAKETAQGARVSEGKFISLKNGIMKFAGADIPDNELKCVIVGWMYHNAYYDPNERYDPENPQSPICYAFATTPPDDGEMEPLDTVPEKQCDNCAECPFNQWESAKQGKGKACKNTVRLALISADDVENLDEAEIVYLSVPVTSGKNWLKYVVDMRDKIKRPLWSVVTTIECVPDNVNQFKLQFKTEENVEDQDAYQPLKDMWAATMETINFPYVVREPSAPVKGKGNAPAPKKKSKFSK